jgi:hypothetical protein
MDADGGSERTSINISAPTLEHAQRLAESIRGFPVEVRPGGSYTVSVTPDAESSLLLVSLFNAVGAWLTAGDLTSARIGFGEASLTVLPASAERLGDPTEFLLERSRQLETALTSRIVIEQAKGVLAERLSMQVDAAFAVLRREARNSQRKIHEVAADVVSGQLRPAT